MEVDGLASEEGSLGSEDSCHAAIRAVREVPTHPSGCGNVRGEGWRGWARMAGGGHQGPWGWVGSHFRGDPTSEWCVRAFATAAAWFRTGVSQPGGRAGEAGVRRSCWMGSDSALWFQTWGFQAAPGCRQCLCFNIWLCGVFIAVQASSLVAASRHSSWRRCSAFPGGGFSCCRAQPLSFAPGHVGSPGTRDQTHVRCIGGCVLIHCASREVLNKV